MATGNALTVQSRAVSASEALATCSTLSNQGVYGSNSFTGATTGPYPVFKDLNWHSVHIDCRNVFVRRANLITCSGYYPKEPGAQHLRVKEKMLNDDGFPLLLPASESPLHKWVRPGTVVVSTLPTASVSDQGPNKTEESSNGTSSTWLLPYSISTDSVYTISATPGRNIPVGIEAGTTMSLAPSPGESGTMDGCALIPTTEVDTAVLSRIEESCNPSGTSTRDGSSVYACIQSGLHGASTTSQSESHGITDSPFATTVSSSQGSLPSTNKHCDSELTTSMTVSTKRQSQSSSPVTTNISWISIVASESRLISTASSTAHGANVSASSFLTRTTSSSSPSAAPLASGTTTGEPPISPSDKSSNDGLGHTLSIALPLILISFVIIVALLLFAWRRLHKDSYDKIMPHFPGYNVLHRWSKTRSENQRIRRSRAIYTGDNNGFLDDTYERHRRRYKEDLLKVKAKRSLETSTTSLARNRASLPVAGTNARDGVTEHSERPVTQGRGVGLASDQAGTATLASNSAAETESMESWEEKWHSFGQQTQSHADPAPTPSPTPSSSVLGPARGPDPVARETSSVKSSDGCETKKDRQDGDEPRS